jgi:molybdopterin-binding protein
VVEIEDLGVDLGDFSLRGINLDIQRGEYFIILGPTGSGKTVLLESIAGIYPIKRGRIWIDREEVTKLSPERRGIGFVYQDYVLFPHLSVEKNISFGLRSMGRGGGEIEEKVSSIAEILGISHLLRRNPSTLSGGERQKVALGRALIIEPNLLLLDEPLSQVDPQNREDLQQEIRKVHERLRVTTIHVTHDFEEAISLGDRIAVLSEGRIVQVGTVEEIFRRPSSEFVARFTMARNVFGAFACDGKDGYSTIQIEGGTIEALTELRGKAYASIRPEDILISELPLPSSARNSLRGKITHIFDRGSTVYLTIDVPPRFVSLVTRRSFEEMKLEIGKEVCITFKAAAVHVF